MEYQPIVMLRPKEIWKRCGKGRSAFYDDIARGLMPRLVAVGLRAKALPAHEVDAVNAARVAGRSENQIRELVRRLEAARGAA